MGYGLHHPGSGNGHCDRSTFAGGILAEGGDIAFWDIDRKCALHDAVEEAVAGGAVRNELLEALGIDRLVYYYRIDDVVIRHRKKEEHVEPMRRSGRVAGSLRHTRSSVDNMPLQARLSLIAEVRDDDRAANHADACFRAGIDQRTYGYLLRNEASWKAALRQEAEDARLAQQQEAEQKRRRRKWVPEQRQRLVVDAVELLHAGAGYTVAEAAELFDRNAVNVYQWRARHALDHLVSREQEHDGRKKRRSPEEVVRIVFAVRAIAEHVGRKASAIMQTLDTSYPVYAQWRSRVKAIDTYLRGVADTGIEPAKHVALIRSVLTRETGIPARSLDAWLLQLEKSTGNEDLRSLLRALTAVPPEPQPAGTLPAVPEQAPRTRALPDLSSLDDVELVRLAQQNDALAMGELWTRNLPMLRRVAVRYCFDENAAEDLLQSAFIHLQKKIVGLQDPHALSGWLRTAIRRMAINEHGRSDRRHEVSYAMDRQDGAFLQYHDVRAADPAEQAEKHEEEPLHAGRIRDLHAALEDGVDPLHHRMLQMRYFQGLRLNEMAAVEGVPIGTIKRRLFVARERAKAALLAHGIGTNGEGE